MEERKITLVDDEQTLEFYVAGRDKIKRIRLSCW